jgi:hypothetical protein
MRVTLAAAALATAPLLTLVMLSPSFGAVQQLSAKSRVRNDAAESS